MQAPGARTRWKISAANAQWNRDMYLAIEHASFLIDLLFVIVVDTKPLEENLVFVGGHGSLDYISNPQLMFPVKSKS